MSGRPWTEEEITYLDEHRDRMNTETMAKYLGRSCTAVRRKMSYLGMAGFMKSTDMVTVYQVATALGVSCRSVNKWEKNHGLKFRRIGMYRLATQDTVLKFLMKHRDLWKPCNVQDWTFFIGWPELYEKRLDIGRKPDHYWSEADVSRLKMYRAEGLTVNQIAERIGRSPDGVKDKLSWLRRVRGEFY